MLENILNNVSASTDLHASQKTASKPSDSKDADTPKTESFKDLLEKNLQTSAKKSDKPALSDKSNDVKDSKDKTKTPQALSSLHDSPHDALRETPDSGAKHAVSGFQKGAFEGKSDSPASLLTQPGGSSAKNPVPSLQKDAKAPIVSDKKTSDVIALANGKNLNAKNVSASNHSPSGEKTAVNDAKNARPEQTVSKDAKEAKELKSAETSKPLTQNLLEQKSKITSLKSTPEKSDSKTDDKSLSAVLRTLESVDKKELATRKKFNAAHKTEYKTEGGEKVAVIERGAKLPKNVVGPRLALEKREEKLEVAQNKPQALQEAISNSLVKDLKGKTASKTSKDAKTDEAASNKEVKPDRDVQKKTAKSLIEPLLPSVSKDAKALSRAKDSKDFSDKEFLDQKIRNENDNLQAVLTEKTKKKQTETEAKKSDEKVKEATSKDKDPTQISSLGPKNDLSQKGILAKETVKNFARNFAEELKNYKPPMSKISLELHPEKLGKLEITIKQAGKNLQVSVVSNHQAIALFAQNQAELRQSLALIGFEGVDLSFSSSGSGGESGQNSDEAKKRNKNGLKQYEDVKSVANATHDTMEMTIPKYA